MTRSEAAFAAMAESKMNCAQAVLTAFCEGLCLDKLTALKLARGFGGGMGRSGKTCGAVTGAYMVLGLREAAAGREGIEAVYIRMGEFNCKFAAVHGSTECHALLDCDLSNPQELTRARAEGLFGRLCPSFVRTAVDILDQ
jgi:C_GCAxxG_C_C family probable redox protein